MVNLIYLETILVHPTRRQNFAGKLDSTFHNIWDLVLYPKEVQNRVWHFGLNTGLATEYITWTKTELPNFPDQHFVSFFGF